MAFFATIWWFAKRIFWFCIDNWKVVLPVFLVIVFAFLVFKACRGGDRRLDERQIQKAQQAIAKQDREEMQRILAESDTREAEIDSNIKQIELDREAAKRNYTGWSNDQMAAELERRAQQ